MHLCKWDFLFLFFSTTKVHYSDLCVSARCHTFLTWLKLLSRNTAQIILGLLFSLYKSVGGVHCFRASMFRCQRLIAVAYTELKSSIHSRDYSNLQEFMILSSGPYTPIQKKAKSNFFEKRCRAVSPRWSGFSRNSNPSKTPHLYCRLFVVGFLYVN